ncbi:MAG: flagellar hook-associated protein FlgK [Candidatus Accumulibacter sp.]|jgi:flagellar hook-associated protein 1 FlgK|nr:flagellar hook-associated protein FlgK [Accumulibacter sp.]
MSVGIFSIGVHALQNAQISLMTTEHNIANIATPGYNRQRTIPATNVPYYTGAGYVGTGAHIMTIGRMYDIFITGQANREQTAVSELQTYAADLAHINNILMDDTAGMSSALKDFFASIQQVAADPSSLTARQSMLSMGQVLAARFQSLDSRLSELYQSANTRIQGDVSMINSYAHQIADLNLQISIAESTHQPPNDLYDRRDQLVTELNKYVRVNVTQDSSGAYTVSIGTGHQLVTRTHVTEFEAIPSSADPARLVVGLKLPTGTQELPDSEIIGGSLGGTLKFRADSLDKASNSLGRIAASVALTFNAQHALGQDLNGNIQGDANFMAKFFTVPEPNVIPDSRNGAGAPVITAEFLPPSYEENFYTNLTDSDYELEWDGANWTLTRLTDRVSWSAPSIAALNTAMGDTQGFRLNAAGFTPGNYSYTIRPTRDMARNFAVDPKMAADTRQIAVAAPVRTSAGAANAGHATISAGMTGPGYSVAGTPVTLTYNKASNDFSIAPALVFPVDVTVNGVTTSYSGNPVPYINGATIAFNGIRFEINGSPENGDTFEIARNTGGISDNRNALLLGQLQTGNTMSGKAAGFLSAYAQLVGDLGSKGREVNATMSAHQILLEQAQSARESISGVNLDEEAANLLRYQQAYQAAAKMIDIASKMFDAILAIRT